MMAMPEHETGRDELTGELADHYQQMYFAEAGTIKSQVKMMTPAWCQGVLESKNRHNRRMKPVTVKGIVEDILGGRWRLNGEPVVFDATGMLIDGQHRLAAVVESGVAVPAVVVTGVAPESFASHGQSRPRTRGDILSIPTEGHESGESNAVALAAALAMVYRWEQKQMGNTKVSPRNTELLDLLARHPGIRDSIPAVRPRCTKGVHTPSTFIALHYLIGMKDAAARDQFFDQILDGVNVDPGSHVFLLNRWLKNNASRLKSHEMPTVAALVIKTWNRIRSNTPIGGGLMWKQGIEEFPEIL